MPLIPPARSLLWRSLRIHQVYGANTEVGKTVVTTILCKGAHRLWADEETSYLKPVSTGAALDADDLHIQKFAPEINSRTLFQYELALSPHIAAQASGQPIVADKTVLAEISKSATRQASRGPGWLFVETAGGVHSPAPSGSTQADLYRPLRLPVVLVGDSKLGGISQTISAFESLKLRGYDVEMVLLFREGQFQNHQYLAEYFKDQHNIPVMTFPEPPNRIRGDTNADIAAMSRYYEYNSGNDSNLHEILAHLHTRHNNRISRLESMSSKASETIWYPFTQQKDLIPSKITTIDSAHGDWFQTLTPQPPTTTTPPSLTTPPPLLQPSFDGSASWWTQGLGHGTPQLSLAAAYAAGRYGHVMFAEAVHEPALALAETLLKGMGNQRLKRAFFSDNGSTGVEVAVKMALRAVRVRGGLEQEGGGGEGRLGVLGLRGSYHGDTIGAMDCSEPCVYNEKVEWYEGRGFWFAYPVVEYSRGRWRVKYPEEVRGLAGGRGGASYGSLSDVFDVEAREGGEDGKVYEKFILATLKKLTAQGHKFGALMIEPVVLGAGGMLLVDPLFQRTLVKVVRQNPTLFGDNSGPAKAKTDERAWSGLPVIFDEVFTGLYRLGRFSAASFLGADADISVHAKLLTGGLVPLSVTLASDSIFNAFASEDKSDALLHGHSYTAHAVGCQVALESLRELQQTEARGDWDWAKAAHNQTGISSQAKPERAPERRVWSVWSPEFVSWIDQLPSEVVSGVWALGSVLAIRITSPDGLDSYKSSAAKAVQAALLQSRGNPGIDGSDDSPWNVHTRVLGNTLYVMTGQTTSQESVRRLEHSLRQAILEAQNVNGK
ncbi:pyridoxal phosphate-dependent transferase [Chaetomium tenue]|uniref:Pyridoxal phosphate-dependent transferase n=1 Tax=Chaetomium tenue TaxID=1854479 RepID=A0ACB7PQ39_9PEZI|nr:pyridoxal phosphate-dependent transferase [Chaetomium globosum]